MSQEAIDRGDRRRRKSEESGLNVKILTEGHIFFVQSGNRPRLRPNDIGRPDVVEMGVRMKKIECLELVPCEVIEDFGGLFSRIEDDGRSCLLATENDAVTLKWADRKGLEDHAL